MQNIIGRNIQLFLVDGTPSGLIIVSIHGWTGSILVSTQSTFGRLLNRQEVDRTGVYILYGPDPNDALKMRAYIGEADSVKDRIGHSAGARGFWETAVVITTSDEALTKGHVRYLEARLIDLANMAGRASLDNSQMPDADRRRLPEADKANMEAFLENLKVVLPVIGLDLLKSKPRSVKIAEELVNLHESSNDPSPRFEIRHKSGVQAYAVEEDGEFIVQEGSEALRNAGYKTNSYAKLKEELIDENILIPVNESRFRFSKPYAFSSPSAAGAIILDRNTNGRTKWYLAGTKMNYHTYQGGEATDTYDDIE